MGLTGFDSEEDGDEEVAEQVRNGIKSAAARSGGGGRRRRDGGCLTSHVPKSASPKSASPSKPAFFRGAPTKRKAESDSKFFASVGLVHTVEDEHVEKKPKVEEAYLDEKVIPWRGAFCEPVEDVKKVKDERARQTPPFKALRGKIRFALNSKPVNVATE
eukprot:jgi/Mesvir1/15078/Mv14722-RA.1